jgi:hypothetical protein
MSATIAGKRALIKVSGAATAFTAEATTMSGVNTVYQITDATKRILDRTATITVKDGGVPTVEAYTLDRLRGKVTFGSAVARVITIDGSYLPMSTAAKCRAFGFTISAANLDDSDFESVQASGGFISRRQGLLDVSGTLGRRWTTDTYFSDALTAGVPVVIEFFLDYTSTTPHLCVWALLDKDGAQAAVDGLVEEDVEFQGTTDADGRAVSMA